MGLLMVASSFLLLPLTLVISAIGTLRWKGRWRALAAVPMLAVAAYFAVILIPAWMKDPTSHNMFPFELGIYLSPTIPYMAVVWWLHRKAAPREAVRALRCAQCGVENRPGPSTCSGCGASLKGAERLSALDLAGVSAGKITREPKADSSHLDGFGE